MNFTTLKSRSTADLIAVPAIMLGFHPEDSCVVLALRENRVELCARLDIDWYASNSAATIQQVSRAARQVQADSFIVIGYAEKYAAERSVAEMVSHLGSALVAGAYLVDGQHYWVLGADSSGQAYSYDTSSLAAEAVLAGRRVELNREVATALLAGNRYPTEDDIDRATACLAGLEPDKRLAKLKELVEAPTVLSTTEAIQLAYLLEDEDSLAAVLTRLNTETAPILWPQLVAARNAASSRNLTAILGVLAIASWLAGQPATHSACLEEIAQRPDSHPVALLAQRLYHAGMPPQRWNG